MPMVLISRQRHPATQPGEAGKNLGITEKLWETSLIQQPQNRGMTLRVVQRLRIEGFQRIPAAGT
jgi:hypothetical protein